MDNQNNKKINTSVELNVDEQKDLESIVVNFPALVVQHDLRKRAQQYVTIANATLSNNVSRKRRNCRLSTSLSPRVVVATQQLNDAYSCQPSVLRLVHLLTKLFIKLELICIQ